MSLLNSLIWKPNDGQLNDHLSTGDIKNGKDVLLTDKPMVNILDLSMFPGNRLQKFMETNLIAEFATPTCETSLQSKALHKFLREDHHFDIILTEFFNTNCFFGLIDKYKAPFIGELLPTRPNYSFNKFC